MRIQLIACAALCLATARAQVPDRLDKQLLQIGATKLAAEARALGDAKRGAVVFYSRQLSCTRCHVTNDADNPLGPDLSALDKTTSDAHLIESILEPSKVIRDGYEPVLVETDDETLTGVLVKETAAEVTIRAVERDFKQLRFAKKDLEDFRRSETSVMPSGLANLMTRQQFRDLVRYLIEIRDGGKTRAVALEPDPSLYADRPLPDYENRVDHAGFLRELDKAAFGRGAKIYNRLCVNCHGSRDELGSLPTSLKFASGKFKNGSDPYTMYQTLTRGFGLMNAQTWMVPSQKYDVIHYIREEYLKRDNPSQYFRVDEKYLASLPKGDTRGPAPSSITKWQQMDYGPNQILTLEIGKDGKNFAYKGNAIRLDAGPGGVAQGAYWMIYDYDTMRVAAAWKGKGFIDWNCIHFNGRHAVHPRLVGDLQLANPTGPGWGRPGDASFTDIRLVGRDKRRYGPLPRDWAHYKGMYYHGPNTLIEYTVGDARVLEMPEVQVTEDGPVYRRVFNIGPRSRDMTLQVAHHEGVAKLTSDGDTATFGAETTQARAVPRVRPQFSGGTRIDVANTKGLNAATGDFTVTAKIRTKRDGTILAVTDKSMDWKPNGLSLFIRNGRLTVDIGWVGAFTGRRRVANGKWHHVAFRYEDDTGNIQFFIDGKKEKRGGTLRRKKALASPILRIGCTARDFPAKSFFRGKLEDVRFYNGALDADEIAELAARKDAATDKLGARWDPSAAKGDIVADVAGGSHPGKAFAGKAKPAVPAHVSGLTVAGHAGQNDGFAWLAEGGDLRLRIPKGDDTRRFTLWFGLASDRTGAGKLASAVVIDEPSRDLRNKTRGGAPRWPHTLTSKAAIGADDGPFSVDTLHEPEDNPWFCRMRLTGFDFADDDTAIVSSWDGSIWKVTGLATLPATGDAKREVELKWRRIASGLFQPLGVKIVDGKTYVTCRDQLCILHDLNGDEEIDWFESFNSDHQVTDHFHEFAMGLQVDGEGNFYYAKSARHAKTALVPHHGTLLRVSKDGSKTDIVANGFRAANGVCLNPDGSFIVTDQEGHWNPKNRINYVKPGGFYGNMYGYHDVTDSSDSAMQQPLCWITNEFDRSPAELLWVDSPKWKPLQGRLLNLSYGYGMVYVVPHERIDGQEQGGMCAFPIKRFPTGVMRGRFHPNDGQLYLAGMFAWAGSQSKPGGLYRLRYTGQPVHLPVELKAAASGVTITFSGTLDEASAETKRWAVKAWDLKRTKRYGSKHFNERKLEVTSARLGSDRRTVHLQIRDLAPTWGMEIKYELRSEAGKTIKGRIHNTIHRLKASR